MSNGLNGRAILAQGLVRDFGKVRAVDGVDLSVAEGEIYGFLGPNGAGKSTVVRMLTTLLLPTAGRAFIAGLDPISRVRVWEEVQRVNKQLGVTIFLTTQYLEEADSLAHRVGIIDEGKLAAEGPPAHLKRTVGSDIIIAEIEGDMSAAHSAVRNIEGVSAVEAHETELTISVENGPASISSVALALHDSEITPNNLTLRTPTLDDVFLSVTGGRLEVDAPAAEDES